MPALLPISSARTAGKRLGLRTMIVMQELPSGQWGYTSWGATKADCDRALAVEVQARAAAAGRLDLKRLAVLRTASNFDRPHPGQTAQASLAASTSGGSGGFMPATHNLTRVGGVLVRDILARWTLWRDGVPSAK